VTTLKYGDRVRIKGVTDTGDTDLNGKTGELSPKFFTDKKHVLGDVGVWLDEACDGARQVNVFLREIEKETP
jgi:hypothetical protein